MSDPFPEIRFWCERHEEEVTAPRVHWACSMAGLVSQWVVPPLEEAT